MLRREIRARRDALDDVARAAHAVRIDRYLNETLEAVGPLVVLSYVSFGSEFDTVPFNRAVLQRGAELLLPRVSRSERRLDVYRVTSIDEDLESGIWGIREPRPDRCSLWEGGTEVSLVLVPGVAFDREGRRLGYGAGYYDRLLPRLGAALRVAAAFELQMVPAVPTEPHDLPVHVVATDEARYCPRS